MKYIITSQAGDGFTFGCDVYEIFEGDEAGAVTRATEIEQEHPEDSPYNTRPVHVYELGRQIV